MSELLGLEAADGEVPSWNGARSMALANRTALGIINPPQIRHQLCNRKSTRMKQTLANFIGICQNTPGTTPWHMTESDLISPLQND
jgi:hypothetical protein